MALKKQVEKITVCFCLWKVSDPYHLSDFGVGVKDILSVASVEGFRWHILTLFIVLSLSLSPCVPFVKNL